VHRTDELPRPDGDAADASKVSDPREEGTMQKIGFLGDAVTFGRLIEDVV
jgi:hypothetical protein